MQEQDLQLDLLIREYQGYQPSLECLEVQLDVLDLSARISLHLETHIYWALDNSQWVEVSGQVLKHTVGPIEPGRPGLPIGPVKPVGRALSVSSL